MNRSIKHQSIKIFVSILIVLFCRPSLGQKKDDTSSAKKIYGVAAVLTNYVDKGLTQSDKSWALQAGFGYQMGPQARLGLWGSSVKLPSNTENMNLRLYFDVKIDFTPNTGVILKYDFNRYFQSESHNGNILTADFLAFGYHITLEQNSNWEGTSNASTWFGFSKAYNLPASFIFTPQLGYSQLSTTGYNNYFDARAEVGYKFAEVMYAIAATYTSAPSQFNGQGDMAILFSLNAKF
jgi:uncharacterized protein (TIGR02001 family)